MDQMDPTDQPKSFSIQTEQWLQDTKNINLWYKTVNTNRQHKHRKKSVDVDGWTALKLAQIFYILWLHGDFYVKFYEFGLQFSFLPS